MRVATDKSDPGYSFYQAIEDKKIDVFLDGVEQKFVEMADEEAGEIIRCVPDAEGLIQVDPNNPDTILRETVRGAVKIVITDRAETAA